VCAFGVAFLARGSARLTASRRPGWCCCGGRGRGERVLRLPIESRRYRARDRSRSRPRCSCAAARFARPRSISPRWRMLEARDEQRGSTWR
jgi:hypothetical protein